MKLAEELIAYNCSETPEAFRQLLIDKLLCEFPGRSVDSLVCRPSDAIKYSKIIRNSIDSNPPDVVILKTLMNIRRAKNCPTGLKSPGPRTRLGTKLLSVGCTLDAAEFEELAVDCLASMYHCQNVDQVLCHPPEATALCNYVRMRSGSAVLTDELILSTLLNIRKKRATA